MCACICVPHRKENRIGAQEGIYFMSILCRQQHSMGGLGHSRHGT